MTREQLERYELAVYAYLDMAEERYRIGVDPDYASVVRWELHHAAEDLRASGIREHELDELHGAAIKKLEVLRRLNASLERPIQAVVCAVL